ncbi:MoxR family ATPase [Helcobacillus massiliensis]|uniref:MoxR-like ATPase n=1 Tax=Helcobacillus massiliensis TaxID=521392 RepID=A0A839QS20_9MICO|nr:MoxR family ATPase [Helcobacillus massiliensis]MBB3023104.1 MoxR-like ATPase [Helcobacillus massiliensis]MBB3023773.1 MoxR-like ATPase [Helcobacillus massiliensis]MCT1557750.1 MoxR family ATPase [Helcobacillus massiliensis]MCT2036022.1 MoxR family ATPase [Helcobacillus massiliensis]MCT2331708.1 MoxR family ATPase [Helcobacillus massiliensis]
MTQHSPVQPLPVADASRLATRILDELERAVVGKRRALEQVLTGILAGGHVLIEDLPGLGKTLTARSFAQALGLPFSRAQFTPDLLPSDLTGSEVFSQATGTFEFRPGPIFTGLLLADEINRTPPKTQAALLEAMQEHQVTVEGTTHQLPEPFHVLATANPVETEGTYPLPEAQLDRFLLRLAFGYPSVDDEWGILERRLGRRQEGQSVDRVLADGELLGMQAAVETVHVSEAIGRYAVEIVQATRSHSSVAMGASPRGSLAFITTARAWALIRGRDYVIPEDIKDLAHPVLGHRILIRPELWLQNISTDSVVDDVLASVPAPSADGALPADEPAQPTTDLRPADGARSVEGADPVGRTPVGRTPVGRTSVEPRDQA